MRNAACWAVAYALVLQAFFATLVATQAAAAGPMMAAEMVLCLPSGDAGPAEPAKTHPDDCCLVCTIAGAAGTPPPVLMAGGLPPRDTATALLPVVRPAAIAFARVRSGETRGPPSA